ncbi:MAG TPA: hypothetical protein VF476_04035 [Chitinophagaceae bacterium]
MRKIFLALGILFISAFAFGQNITDTAAFLAQGGYDNYIKIDDKAIATDFGADFLSRVPNQALIITERNQPKMLIALPSNMSNSKPTPGTYNVMSGKKLGVKKGSQEAKLDIKPNYISTDDGGKIHILYYNELYWFIGENISIIDSKTNETHKISFKISKFI